MHLSLKNWEDKTILQTLERTLKAETSLLWKEENTLIFDVASFRKSYIYINHTNHKLVLCSCFQRIRSTVDEKEQKQLLMDLDVVMRSSACEYIVKFYGALFTEVITKNNIYWIVAHPKPPTTLCCMNSRLTTGSLQCSQNYMYYPTFRLSINMTSSLIWPLICGPNKISMDYKFAIMVL